MGNVRVDLSMSLDGYIAGPNDSQEQPVGDGGQRLHGWMSRTTQELMQDGTAAMIGAMVTGRRTYDLVDGWSGSHPLPSAPVFVLMHHLCWLRGGRNEYGSHLNRGRKKAAITPVALY